MKSRTIHEVYISFYMNVMVLLLGKEKSYTISLYCLDIIPKEVYSNIIT